MFSYLLHFIVSKELFHVGRFLEVSFEVDSFEEGVAHQLLHVVPRHWTPQTVQRIQLNKFVYNVAAVGVHFHILRPVDFPLQDNREARSFVHSWERHLPSVHLKNYAAERPQIRCTRGFTLFNHFWGKVVYCSDECSLPVKLLVLIACKQVSCHSGKLAVVRSFLFLFERLFTLLLRITKVNLNAIRLVISVLRILCSYRCRAIYFRV